MAIRFKSIYILLVNMFNLSSHARIRSHHQNGALVALERNFIGKTIFNWQTKPMSHSLKVKN